MRWWIAVGLAVGVAIHPALAAQEFTLKVLTSSDGKPLPREWKTVSAQAKGKYLQLHITNVEGNTGDLYMTLACARAHYNSFKNSSGVRVYAIVPDNPEEMGPECYHDQGMEGWNQSLKFNSDADAKAFISVLEAIRPGIMNPGTVTHD